MKRLALLLTAVIGCAGLSWAGPVGPGEIVTIDSTTYRAGSSPMGTVGGVFNDSIGPVASSTTAGFRMTPYRGEHVNLRNSSGVEIGTVANPVITSGTVNIGGVTLSSSTSSVTTYPAPGSTTTVSGSVTANAGTNLNTSLLAVESGGNLAAAATVLGSTTSAAVTTNANGTIQQYLRGLVTLIAAGINTTIQNATLAVTQSGAWNIGTLTSITNPVAVTGTFFQATQPVSASSTTFSGTMYQAAGSSYTTTFTNTSITANAGTNLNTSLLALESGGHLSAIDTSNTAISTNTNAINTNVIAVSTNTASIASSGVATSTNTAAINTNIVAVSTNTGAISTVLGSTTAAAVITDINGTVQQYLRGLVKIFADVYSSSNHWLSVSVANSPTVNQGTAGSSAWPVTLSGGTGPSGSQLTLSGQIFPATTGTIGTSTDTFTVFMSSYSNVTVGVAPSTATGVTINFEESVDSATTWGSVACAQQGTATYNAAYTLTTSTVIFTCSVPGGTNFRVRTSARTGGFATITLKVTGDPVTGNVVVGQSVAANLLGTMSQGGTWTLQPGNTANTTPWLMRDMGPVSTGTAVGVSNSTGPILGGGIAYTSAPSSVTTSGSPVYAQYAPDGSQVVRGSCPDAFRVQVTTTLANSASEVVILSSGGANIANDLISCMAVNTSATATRIDLRMNGNATSTFIPIAIPAGPETRPCALNGQSWSQLTSNANWTAQESSGVSSIILTLQFCKRNQ